jgi:sentrin-specific protease 1
MINPFRVLFKWFGETNKPKTKVETIDLLPNHINTTLIRQEQQITTNHTSSFNMKADIIMQDSNPHDKPTARVISSLNKQKRSTGKKGSRRGRQQGGNSKHTPKFVPHQQISKPQHFSFLDKQLFSPSSAQNQSIRTRDERLSSHAFKPRNYQLAIASAKMCKQKNDVLKDLIRQNDEEELDAELFGHKPQEQVVVEEEEETVEDIELRNMTRLMTLREKSAIYILDQKLYHDQLANIMHSTLITEILDEICTEEIEREIKIQLPEKILDQLIHDVTFELVKEEKEFIPMTQKDQQKVQNILSIYKDEEEVIVEGYQVEMKRSKMLCLRPGQWLNDEVINFYLGMCGTRGENATPGTVPRVYYHTTLFYTKLMQRNQYSYAGVKRWTRKVDLFAMDKVIIPIHLGVHWTCAVINLRDKQFEYYDSMNGSARGKQILKDLQRYIQDESMDKKGVTLDTSSWSFVIPDSYDLPQQENSHDCGVFTCKFANFVGQDLDITFSQEHMPYFRNRMALEIANKRVL